MKIPSLARGMAQDIIFDVRLLAPEIGERVLVWHSGFNCWLIATYTLSGTMEERYEKFREWHGRSVPKARWWIPLPGPPEGERAFGEED